MPFRGERCRCCEWFSYAIFLHVGVRNMRITAKGQVTIPADIRERAGLLPETEVEFRFDGKVVSIVKAKFSTKPGRGAKLISQMRGKGDVKMRTDEIMALTRGE